MAVPAFFKPPCILPGVETQRSGADPGRDRLTGMSEQPVLEPCRPRLRVELETENVGPARESLIQRRNAGSESLLQAAAYAYRLGDENDVCAVFSRSSRLLVRRRSEGAAFASLFAVKSEFSPTHEAGQHGERQSRQR